MSIRAFIVALGIIVAPALAVAGTEARLAVLLLGDRGHHNPAELAKLLAPAMADRGIDITYTDDVDRLNPAELAEYRCVAIYRDSGDLPPAAETALMDFIEVGHGLVAIHCASHTFRNSDRYTKLVGGRFQSHETGIFRAHIIDAQHPAMRGLSSFKSWDETYVHNELSADRRVLMVREHSGGYEPWTWVRQQGPGRVFYTASGHDARTWSNPGFQQLIERGLRWAAGDLDDDAPPLHYSDAGEGLPNYVPSTKWGSEGERIKKMQEPLSPADSMRHMHLPEGLKVELFAAEPDVVKPLAMAFDARGRLWVAESVDYPNIVLDNPENNGHDRIKICEDTDGDGRADKFTIFADKLNIPTGLQLAKDGVIVAVAPHLLYLQDTDGDGVADKREILCTGFGRRDTHAVVSNLHYGQDNWIWGSVGYGGGQIRADGKTQRFAQGYFRFRNDGSAFEVLTSTSNNTWGLGFDESGDVFGSTANGQHSVHLAIPNRYYESVRGWHGNGSSGIEDHKKMHPVTDNVRQVDWFGGFTAASGHEVYTARSLPQRYWDRVAFVCEPTGHLVHMNLLAAQGSGFVAHDGYNLMASSDAWTSPIAAQAGPDGAVWILDWYNYIVQHNPTPEGFKTGEGAAYVTPLRDKTHGRIYRIVPTERPAAKPLNLEGASPAELIAALGHENLFWRLTAQRLLVDRGDADALPKLAELVSGAQYCPAAVHALHTMDGLGAFKQGKWTEVLQAGLTSRNSALRRTALAVLPRTESSVRMILAAESLADPEILVRKDALLALAEMPASQQAAQQIVALLAHPSAARDRWLTDAATSAAAPSDAAFLAAAASAQSSGESVDALVAAVRVVAEHYARGEPVRSLPECLAALTSGNPAVLEAAIGGFAAGWPAKRPPALSERSIEKLAGALSRLSPQGRLEAVVLGKRWNAGSRFDTALAESKKALLTLLADDQKSDDERLASAHQLATIGLDETTVSSLFELLTPKISPELAASLIDVAGQSTADSVGSAIVDHWARLTPSSRGKALAVLLRRPEWTKSLLDALEKDQIKSSELPLEQSQQLSRHPDTAIAQRAQILLASRGNLPSADRQKVLAELLPLAEERGDASHGRTVFEQNCAKCHRHGSLGAKIGPDLTGVAVRKRAEILTDVLDPNRSVEGNYQQYTIVTGDGRILSGLLVSETKTSVELMDAEAKKHIVLREDIEELTPTKLSIMPVGFEKIARADLVDLLEFLTARGKFLPLSLEKVATVVSTKGMFYDETAELERLVLPDWEPKTVFDVPFRLIDPQSQRLPNVIMLYGPQGKIPPHMPRSVTIPCNSGVKAIHLLGGVAGWAFPLGKQGSVSMIVRLHYEDGKTEDHELRNGQHLADYIRRVDVPGSKLAFMARGQQVRYLSITPGSSGTIQSIELVKGEDETAPLVMAITVETP